jgi:Xaa-Pro aminopeptidase
MVYSQLSYEQDQLKPDLYKSRRQQVIDKMEANSIALFKAADVKNRNSDNDYLYRQNSNFYYLTGFNESESILLLSHDGLDIDGKKSKEILFLREKNPLAERWTGVILGSEGAKTILGLEAASAIKNFKEFIKNILNGKKILYVSSGSAELYYDIIIDKKYYFDQERKKYLQETFPGLEIKSIGSIINPMRQIKSPEEIRLIQKAIDATCKGYIEATKSCEPEMYEFELQGIIEYSMRRFGCDYTGFPSIIGSGPNSLVFHYDANNRQMKNGDLVVMDIGGEYYGYSADITRTIPVNGKFSQPQKDIYNIVLKANQEVINAIKPDVQQQSLQTIAMKFVSEGLIKLGIIKTEKDAFKFLPHGISHDIGLDVHDVYTRNPLRAGQVITVEPGIYIPPNSEGVDQKYWNIGIRIEDDILVTETGNKVLTSCAPKTTEEIEKIMKKKGVGNQVIGE